ncbi:uncharacterized protein UDID_10033 [Ustilago sp. UG-2017a]|nr:uncharacterized protein UDID_10033 [Ustilago sp. UG-2017a]
MRFASLVILLTLLSTAALASMELEEPESEPHPDFLHSISSNSFAQHHARSVISYLSLPSSTITRVDPPDYRPDLRFLVHDNTDSSRNVPLCYRDEHCLMVSLYKL